MKSWGKTGFQKTLIYGKKRIKIFTKNCATISYQTTVIPKIIFKVRKLPSLEASIKEIKRGLLISSKR